MRRKMSSIIMIGIWGVLLLGLLALHFIPGVQHFLVAAGEFVLRRSLNEPIWVERFTSCWMLFFIFAVCFFGGAIIARKKWKIPFLLCANLFLNWFMMEYGIVYTAGKHYDNKILILSILTYASVIFVLIIISQRVWLSGVIGTTILFLYSIANYYTIKFHSSPLTLLEVRNAKTALSVFGNYDLTPDSYVFSRVLLFGASISVCIVAYFYEKREEATEKKIILQRGLLRTAILLLLILGTYYFGYFGRNPIKPPEFLNWSWEYSAEKYGLSGIIVESTVTAFKNPIIEPIGLKTTELRDINALYDEAKHTKKPDVIVILNESFFDLRRVVNLETDTDFLTEYDSLQAIKGYAVAPNMGGKTNSSEYELLTSNSHNLVNGTPFQVLDLENINSIVSVMKNNGYETLGFHTERSSNYNRAVAYKCMGFDHIFFGEDITLENNVYGTRWYLLDTAAYKYLTNWYEEMGEGPRFCYLLTTQNHGGYTLNDDQLDTVHVNGDYGISGSEMNEYLTSIKQSDGAIRELIEYYKKCDRDVVICFVGDHSPPFISNMDIDKADDVEAMISERATPFFIWSNFEEHDDNIGYIGMMQLLPYMMEQYEIVASPYYGYLEKLRDDYPVIANGLYIDSNGKKCLLDMNNYDGRLREYFNLEYMYIKGD